jgi:hypothetical protein
MLRVGRTAAWVLFLVSGCASERALGCPGGAPALEDCALGVYHADCGGDGEPAFACDEVTGACRWFTGGCVASGHRVSDCPIEDRCCHTSADGPWAFEDGWMPAAFSGAYFPRTRLQIDIATVGATPIDATSPDTLTVAIDAAVTATVPPTATCEGELGVLGGALCRRPLLVVPSRTPHHTFALEVWPSGGGSQLTAEVLDAGEGLLRGRVFAGYLVDYEPPEVPASCASFSAVGGVIGGTLRIERLDPAAHGELVVHALEGGTITVRF